MSGRLQSWSFGEYGRSYSRLLDGQRVRVSVTLAMALKDLVDTTSSKFLTFHFSVKEIWTQVTGGQNDGKSVLKEGPPSPDTCQFCRGTKTFAA